MQRIVRIRRNWRLCAVAGKPNTNVWQTEGTDWQVMLTCISDDGLITPEMARSCATITQARSVANSWASAYDAVISG